MNKFNYSLVNRYTGEVKDLETSDVNEALNIIGDKFGLPEKSIKVSHEGCAESHKIVYEFGYDDWVLVGNVRSDK